MTCLRIYLFVSTFLLCIPLHNGSADELQQSAPRITIGAILPLSGEASNFGAIARRGIEMALDSLSAEDRARVSVVFEDDALSNVRSATAARKLLSIDKVDALLTWSSGTGITAASMAESKRIPHISIASDPAVSANQRFSFTYWPIASDEAQQLLAYMKARGIKRIALLSQVHNGILAIRQALMQLVATNQGIEIVANEEVTGDLTDFRGILQRIKSQGQIDAFLPIFFPQQLSVCIKQARAAGITSQLLGFETFEDKDAIKAAEGLLSGAVYATGGDPIPSFVKEYEQRYPGQSYYTANQAYDIIKLFVDATRTDKSGETIVRFLQGVRDRSTSSGAVSITKGNQFRVPATLKKINEQGMAELLGLP